MNGRGTDSRPRIEDKLLKLSLPKGMSLVDPDDLRDNDSPPRERRVKKGQKKKQQARRNRRHSNMERGSGQRRRNSDRDMRGSSSFEQGSDHDQAFYRGDRDEMVRGMAMGGRQGRQQDGYEGMMGDRRGGGGRRGELSPMGRQDDFPQRRPDRRDVDLSPPPRGLDRHPMASPPRRDYDSPPRRPDRLDMDAGPRGGYDRRDMDDLPRPMDRRNLDSPPRYQNNREPDSPPLGVRRRDALSPPPHIARRDLESPPHRMNSPPRRGGRGDLDRGRDDVARSMGRGDMDRGMDRSRGDMDRIGERGRGDMERGRGDMLRSAERGRGDFERGRGDADRRRGDVDRSADRGRVDLERAMGRGDADRILDRARGDLERGRVDADRGREDIDRGRAMDRGRGDLDRGRDRSRGRVDLDSPRQDRRDVGRSPPVASRRDMNHSDGDRRRSGAEPYREADGRGGGHSLSPSARKDKGRARNEDSISRRRSGSRDMDDRRKPPSRSEREVSRERVREKRRR